VEGQPTRGCTEFLTLGIVPLIRIRNGIYTAFSCGIIVEEQGFLLCGQITNGTDQAVEEAANFTSSFLVTGFNDGDLIRCRVAVTTADHMIWDGWIVGLEEIERGAAAGQPIFVLGREF
jgi:hypothetical protein